jgi:competence protein CoiA
MQLFARNAEGGVTPARQAARQQDYFCRECGGPVRVRGGRHRQFHFFHLKPTGSCRLNGKSLQHLQVQLYLEKAIGTDCVLEHRLPEINRIADALWTSRNIVFEVQCSGITKEELLQRNADYASQGLQVVWILHNNRYGKNKSSQAEEALVGQVYYYTDINHEGKGGIYDQLTLLSEGWQRSHPEQFAVNISQMHDSIQTSQLHPIAARRLSFEGDLTDRCATDPELLERLQKWIASQQLAMGHSTSPYHRFKKIGYKLIVRPYLIALQMMLEKSCR